MNTSTGAQSATRVSITAWLLHHRWARELGFSQLQSLKLLSPTLEAKHWEHSQLSSYKYCPVPALYRHLQRTQPSPSKPELEAQYDPPQRTLPASASKSLQRQSATTPYSSLLERCQDV
ncbi:hypothetical protein B9Z19DRAFT_1064479 [Tuber borchii]|uniref:Uncharacterized protein n=1 Tax=Tuber borchii TaxID=42251 RepID=A0A2T6ZUI8_TUBBO|nr:hypothetical protein B9Z19DRAFT_1064479 [Tuber borchii]